MQGYPHGHGYGHEPRSEYDYLGGRHHNYEHARTVYPHDEGHY